jgi:hypothetical protein
MNRDAHKPLDSIPREPTTWSNDNPPSTWDPATVGLERRQMVGSAGVADELSLADV